MVKVMYNFQQKMGWATFLASFSIPHLVTLHAILVRIPNQIDHSAFWFISFWAYFSSR
jgi:hypothetical protein